MAAGGCKFMVLFLAFVLISSTTEAKGTNVKGYKNIVKTIKVDAWDVVDCIDMYNQPAFDHPLLASHTLQIKPSMGTNTSGSKDTLRSIHSWDKKWHRCPHGSIPVKRQLNSTHHFTKRYSPPDQPDESLSKHQYAIIRRSSAGTIHGIQGNLNTWSPIINDRGFSLSQLWLTAGGNTGQRLNLNTVEVGWQVYPSRYRDNQPRLFIFWTNNGYRGNGCYNLDCSGFVQTDSGTVLGGPLRTSTFGGNQYELEVSIQKDTQSGNWWLYVSQKPIGYWPNALFSTLANAGDRADWGGEVTYFVNQMGSGHFSNEGFGKSSYVRGFKYTDTSGNVIQPNSQDVTPSTSAPSCYNSRMDNTQELYFYFGGPGCSQ